MRDLRSCRVVAEKPNIKPGECFLGLAIRHPDGTMLSGIEVAVVNTRDSIIYKSKTDAKGFAYFNFPTKPTTILMWMIFAM